MDSCLTSVAIRMASI